MSYPSFWIEVSIESVLDMVPLVAEYPVRSLPTTAELLNVTVIEELPLPDASPDSVMV